MPSVSWKASARGEYWIDVALDGQPLQVLVDSGLIDARGEVGFSIDLSLYDSFKKAGRLEKPKLHTRLLADGNIAITESGILDSQLFCPLMQIPVGPVVRIRAYRGMPGVPERVGVAFFHLLKRCTVVWDLDQRTWRIDYP